MSIAIAIDVTYEELANLINTNSLEEEISYKITDYRTVHYITYDWVLD